MIFVGDPGRLVEYENGLDPTRHVHACNQTSLHGPDQTLSRQNTLSDASLLVSNKRKRKHSTWGKKYIRGRDSR